MRRYRIIAKRDGYYPQWRGRFFWRYFTRPPLKGEPCSWWTFTVRERYGSVEVAKSFLEETVKEENRLRRRLEAGRVLFTFTEEELLK